ISFAVCEGDDFEIDSEKMVVKHKFGTKRGGIVGAWAQCKRTGKDPFITFTPLKEYFDKNSEIWQHYTSAMIQKVAETIVLKRAYGISGVYSPEEFPVPIDELPAVEPKPLLSEGKILSLETGEISQLDVDINKENSTSTEIQKKEPKKIVALPSFQNMNKKKKKTSKAKAIDLAFLKNRKKTEKKDWDKLQKKIIEEKKEKMFPDLSIDDTLTEEMLFARGDDWFVSTAAKTKQDEDMPLYVYQIVITSEYAGTNIIDDIESRFGTLKSEKHPKETLFELYHNAIESVVGEKEMIDKHLDEKFLVRFMRIINTLKDSIKEFRENPHTKQDYLVFLKTKTGWNDAHVKWAFKYLTKRKIINKNKEGEFK
ncbi:MAG: recombinase RecT, partial [Candidatus Helarchaeota archaeon]